MKRKKRNHLYFSQNMGVSPNRIFLIKYPIKSDPYLFGESKSFFSEMEEKNKRVLLLPPKPESLIGRAEIISQIKTKIINRNVVLLTGVGGIGKTTLSRFIAHEFAKTDDFPGGILWMNLGNSKSIKQAYHIIADQFKFPYFNKEDKELLVKFFFQ